MAGQTQLSERKAAILRALVRHYIHTGEPVGSEALATESGLSVSSATIRNELAALEELGYLTQPHTSAGRAPTDLAYRYYVDLLPARTRLRDAERRAIVHFFDEALEDIDAILRGTTLLLSNLTRYASLALAPSPRQEAIARAELVSVGSGTLLLLVFESSRVEKRVMELPAGVAAADVERVSSEIAGSFRGETVAGARAVAEARSRIAPQPDRGLFAKLADALAAVEEAVDAEHVFMGGVTTIAAHESFQERETLRQIYETLERESAMLRLLREAAVTPPVAVMIGRENPMPEMWEASVIAATYGAAGGAVGMIGIVGPTRMDYAAAMSAVRAVAERLSAAVEALRA